MMENAAVKQAENIKVLDIKEDLVNGKQVKLLRRDLIKTESDRIKFKVTYIKDDAIFEEEEWIKIIDVYNMINSSDTIDNSTVSTVDEKVLLIATILKIQYPDLNIRLNQLFKDGELDEWNVTVSIPKSN